MPLPPAGTPWPPHELRKITDHLHGWDAWYAGDPIRLAEHYGYLGGGVPGYPVPRALQYRTGVVGAIARWFWGQPAVSQQLTKLHVPIAADICQGGADLLFAEPPAFTVDTKGDGGSATQDRLDLIADDTMHGVLAEAAEVGGALGGSYLRVCWDRDALDQPFLDCKHADAALPEFRYGRLSAVTFWTVVKRDGQQVWRHLERHELDGQGFGIIQHGLYQGSEADLGRLVPLTDVPETAVIAAAELVDGNTVTTGSPGLACVYVPNQRPQRRWRNDPAGRNLGRSDLDGIEHLMDALDETYSSWMRDIRLGKGRVFVAKTLLEDRGAGQGATLDLDQEVFSPLNALQTPSGQGGLPIQIGQFAIRVAEHQTTANQLVEDILRTAGYSSQTFGMGNDSARASNLTATEIQARERRSYMTRDRKIRLWNPQVQAIVEKLLWVDKVIFNSGVTPQRPTVTFADSAQESVITLAQTALALATAKAASTQTLVQMVHPDWPDDQVQEEVTRIHGEEAAAVPTLPDPFGQPANEPPPEPPA